MNKILKSVNKSLDQVYGSPYTGAALAICFLVFAAVVAPDLPPALAGLFANPVFKVLFMALILVMRRYSPVLALLVSVGFVLALQTLHRLQSFATLKEWQQKVSGKAKEAVGAVATGAREVESEAEKVVGAAGTGLRELEHGLITGAQSAGRLVGTELSELEHAGEAGLAAVERVGEAGFAAVGRAGSAGLAAVERAGESGFAAVEQVAEYGLKEVETGVKDTEGLVAAGFKGVKRVLESVIGSSGVKHRESLPAVDHAYTQVTGMADSPSGFMGAQGLNALPGFSGTVAGAPYGTHGSEL